jgi:superfamily I DNA/RNA helicase
MTIEEERDDAVARIVDSDHPKRIVVAGAGAGKTFVFGKLLDQLQNADRDRRLVTTFINELTSDLEEELGDRARVRTLHSFCHGLLRREPGLRAAGLSEGFHYYPKIRALIPRDWSAIKGTQSPKFVPSLRELERNPEVEFFLERASYYDAVGFDDSIVRAHWGMTANPALIPEHDLVIVDEVQDFNQSEIGLILLLARRSKVVVAGDDDQALYGQLRGASERHIRALHADETWETHSLPFCSRCTSVIVKVVNGVVEKAKAAGLLAGRIDKPYRPFPRPDDATYPKLMMVKTSVQSLGKRNYMGRYIDQEIGRIPAEEVADSHARGFPTVLVIGPTHYLSQIAKHLEANGRAVETKPRSSPDEGVVDRNDGLQMLKDNPESNLGWRIVLEADQPAFGDDCIKATEDGTNLYNVIPEAYRSAIVDEAAGWEQPDQIDDVIEAIDEKKPRIKLVTFEGSKGLSAHHVFVIGLQEGVLPRGAKIRDSDVCRFVVALTRTRKLCHVMYTTRFGGKLSRVSRLIDWVPNRLCKWITVDKDYW